MGFSLATLLLASAWSPPSYTRLRPFELIARAEIVAMGEIVRLESETFHLKVESWIHGDDPRPSLTIERFKDWMCAGRYAPYAVGQRLVVFARRGAEQGVDGYVLGAGDEGEWPVLGRDAITQWDPLRGFPVQAYELPDSDRVIRGSRVGLDELAAAITGFRETFTWRTGEYGQGFDYSFRVSKEAALRYARSSKLAKHYYDSVTSNRLWADGLPPAEFANMVAPSFADPHIDRPRFAWNHWTSADLQFVGDLDGDGLVELAVGIPGAKKQKHEGSVWLRYSDFLGRIRRAVSIEAADLGPAAHEHRFDIGSSVASPGDINGDGIPDLVIGANHGNWSPASRGGVWVVLLNSDGTVAHATDLAAALITEHPEEISLTELGLAATGIGDLDGDGGPEIAISSERRGLDFKRDEPIWIVSLGFGGEPRWSRKITYRDAGAESSFSFGSALCGPGDIDGDSLPDLVVGVPWSDEGGDSRGAVHVLFLETDGSVRATQKIGDWSGRFEGLLRDDEYFGRAIGAPGDLDGDGTPDLVVGSINSLWTLFMEPDGTVREHARIGGDLGSEDAAPFGGGIACAPGGERSEAQLIAGGSRYTPFLWDLRLCENGTACER